jgi:hypothetical protein
MTSTDTRITSRVGRGPSPFRDDPFSQPQQDHPAVIEKGDLIRVRKPYNAKLSEIRSTWERDCSY